MQSMGYSDPANAGYFFLLGPRPAELFFAHLIRFALFDRIQGAENMLNSSFLHADLIFELWAETGVDGVHR